MDVSAVVSVVTLGIIVWYTWETRQLRRANSELLQMQKEKAQPLIDVYLDNGHSFYIILMRVRNIGGTPAKNIRVMFQPSFDLGEPSINDYFNKNALFKNGLSYLPAGSEYKVYAGYTPATAQKYRSGQLPTSYRINFEYENLSGQKRQTSIDFNLDHFFYRVDPNDKTVIEKELGKINDNLIKMTDPHFAPIDTLQKECARLKKLIAARKRHPTKSKITANRKKR